MDFIHNNNISNSILIIGNGFDLDLGIKTKYIDFANSEYWPFKERSSFEENTLPFFLNSHKNKVETWFDLEELLAIFARDNSILSKEKINETMRDFEFLKKKLKEYLEKQEDVFFEEMKENTQTKKMSHSILQVFLRMQGRKIYTFNYTNTQKIAKNLILGFKDNVTHIHGSIKENNIILGTGDQRDIPGPFFQFYKSASPYYSSNNLVEDLNNADKIYIFGHSLGRNDHDYFSDFFKKASSNPKIPLYSKKIKIRIFTYDNNSEIDIKKQLMALTNRHLIGLYAHCDFKIIKTSMNNHS